MHFDYISSLNWLQAWQSYKFLVCTPLRMHTLELSKWFIDILAAALYVLIFLFLLECREMEKSHHGHRATKFWCTRLPSCISNGKRSVILKQIYCFFNLSIFSGYFTLCFMFGHSSFILMFNMILKKGLEHVVLSDEYVFLFT